jgi:hypothetical protein
MVLAAMGEREEEATSCCCRPHPPAATTIATAAPPPRDLVWSRYLSPLPPLKEMNVDDHLEAGQHAGAGDSTGATPPPPVLPLSSVRAPRLLAAQPPIRNSPPGHVPAYRRPPPRGRSQEATAKRLLPSTGEVAESVARARPAYDAKTADRRQGGEQRGG